jgi:two-component system, NarL family, invasion response regulator UvrY
MTRLYLLDDHLIVREGVRAVLQAGGMTVVGESDNVADALADIERLLPDVVLLDLGLPEGSGLDLLSRLAERRLPTRVLVLTVSDRPWHQAEALRLGAAGYVLKGASGGQVLHAIRQVMDGHSHFSAIFGADALRAGGDRPVDPMAALSPRERQIMGLVAIGKSSAAIGAELKLSPKTVDTYRSRLMAKLGVHDVANLVRAAVRLGVVDSHS